MDKEFRTKEFIRETDLMVERLKGYKKSDKKTLENVRYEWFILTRLINRVKGKCDKEIMHEQGEKLIREFKKFGDLMPVFKEHMPDVPPEGKDEGR